MNGGRLEEHYDTHEDLYGYNLKKRIGFRVTTDESWAAAPAIYEHVVVWMDLRGPSSEIYGYILPPSLFLAEEKTPEPKEKGEEDGICSGTVLVLLLVGRSFISSKRNNNYQ